MTSHVSEALFIFHLLLYKGLVGSAEGQGLITPSLVCVCYMFVYVFICMHTGRCAHVCIYVRKSEMLDVFLNHFWAYLCKTGSHLECQVTVWLDWLVSKPRHPLVSSSPALGLQAHATTPGFCLFIFIWLPIRGTQVLTFAGKTILLTTPSSRPFSHKWEIH